MGTFKVWGSSKLSENLFSSFALCVGRRLSTFIAYIVCCSERLYNLDGINAVKEIVVKEAPIEEAVQINKCVTEFDPYPKEYFETRYKDKDTLIIAAYIDDKPAGYLVGYNVSDNEFYCWMVGVSPVFRRKGVLKALMDYQEKWAKKREYKKITIKTRNNLREMLAYLVAYGFYFTEVIQRPAVEDNRILLEKKI